MNPPFKSRDILARAFSLRQEAFWVFMGQLGMALGVLFGVKVLTQVLDPFEFGRVTLANTVVLLIGTNLFGPLGQGFMRFWSISRSRGQGQEFVSATHRYAKFLASVVLGMSFVWLMLTSFLEWFEWSLLIWFSLVVGTFTGFFSLRLSVFLAARKRKIVAIVNTSVAFLKPLVAVLFVTVIYASANWVMGAYLLVTLSTLLVVEYLYKDMARRAPSYRRSVDGMSGELGNLGRGI